MMEYRTIAAPVSASFVEKKSEFIAQLFPARTQEEAVEAIEEVRIRVGWSRSATW